jgi:hypothetical protein
MPFPCFSYPADVSPGAENRDPARPVSPGPRTMPATECFSYRAEVPRSMPVPCFNYPADLSLGGRDRDTAQPVLPGLRKMPNICFRY